MTLFDRTWAITVGRFRVEKPMRCAFEVDRNLHDTPSKATVRMWNLTRSQQAEIENGSHAQVVVEAGFENERGLEALFVGEQAPGSGRTASFQQRKTRTDVSAADSVTHVEAQDAGRAFREAHISQSFDPGVSISVVLRACAAKLGVGVGNLEEVARVARLRAGGDTFPEGITLHGQVSRELQRLLIGYELRFSVQHGALQIMRRGQPLQTRAIRLASNTGLVGNPESGTHGRVKIKALLTPDLWPGRRVVLDTDRVSGTYVARSVTYSGDSHAQDWYASCELAPEGAAP